MATKVSKDIESRTKPKRHRNQNPNSIAAARRNKKPNFNELPKEELEAIQKKGRAASAKKAASHRSVKSIINEFLDANDSEEKKEIVRGMIDRAKGKGSMAVKDAQLLFELNGELKQVEAPDTNVNFTVKIDGGNEDTNIVIEDDENLDEEIVEE